MIVSPEMLLYISGISGRYHRDVLSLGNRLWPVTGSEVRGTHLFPAPFTFCGRSVQSKFCSLENSSNVRTGMRVMISVLTDPCAISPMDAGFS